MNRPQQLSWAEIVELAHRFDQVEAVQAVILLGSYARDEAGPYSDIDLIRFVRPMMSVIGDGTHLHPNGILINVSSYYPNDYEKWFTEPDQAMKWIAGLRLARVLIDRENFFADNLQKRVQEFQWNSDFELRARKEAGRRMVGWCEEAHKGLEGLRRGHDIGRLLNACHGLSWGLSDVLQLHYGILLSSDNGVFDQVEQMLANDQRMVQLHRIVFGVVDKVSLRQRVIAGLDFFRLIVRQISEYWLEKDRTIVQSTAKQIDDLLPEFLKELE